MTWGELSTTIRNNIVLKKQSDNTKLLKRFSDTDYFVKNPINIPDDLTAALYVLELCKAADLKTETQNLFDHIFVALLAKLKSDLQKESEIQQTPSASPSKERLEKPDLDVLRDQKAIWDILLGVENAISAPVGTINGMMAKDATTGLSFGDPLLRSYLRIIDRISYSDGILKNFIRLQALVTAYSHEVIEHIMMKKPFFERWPLRGAINVALWVYGIKDASIEMQKYLLQQNMAGIQNSFESILRKIKPLNDASQLTTTRLTLCSPAEKEYEHFIVLAKYLTALPVFRDASFQNLEGKLVTVAGEFGRIMELWASAFQNIKELRKLALQQQLEPTETVEADESDEDSGMVLLGEMEEEDDLFAETALDAELVERENDAAADFLDSPDTLFLFSASDTLFDEPVTAVVVAPSEHTGSLALLSDFSDIAVRHTTPTRAVPSTAVALIADYNAWKEKFLNTLTTQISALEMSLDNPLADGQDDAFSSYQLARKLKTAVDFCSALPNETNEAFAALLVKANELVTKTVRGHEVRATRLKPEEHCQLIFDSINELITTSLSLLAGSALDRTKAETAKKAAEDAVNLLNLFPDSIVATASFDRIKKLADNACSVATSLHHFSGMVELAGIKAEHTRIIAQAANIKLKLKALRESGVNRNSLESLEALALSSNKLHREVATLKTQFPVLCSEFSLQFKVEDQASQLMIEGEFTAINDFIRERIAEQVRVHKEISGLIDGIKKEREDTRDMLSRAIGTYLKNREAYYTKRDKIGSFFATVLCCEMRTEKESRRRFLNDELKVALKSYAETNNTDGVRAVIENGRSRFNSRAKKGEKGYESTLQHLLDGVEREILQPVCVEAEVVERTLVV